METLSYTTVERMLHLGQEAATMPSVQSMEQAWRLTIMTFSHLHMSSTTLTPMDQ